MQSEPYNIKLDSLMQMLERKIPDLATMNVSSDCYDNKLRLLLDILESNILRLSGKTDANGILEA